jgi:hypothetical protein
MKRYIQPTLTLQREDMTESEKKLFTQDLKDLLNEYFEREGAVTLDITRTQNGFSVYILFPARRIKHSRPISQS